MTMTLLYLFYVLCGISAALSIFTGQWLLLLPLASTMYLLRENMLMHQKVNYLLSQNELREAAKTLANRSAALRQVDRVKGV